MQDNYYTKEDLEVDLGKMKDLVAATNIAEVPNLIVVDSLAATMAVTEVEVERLEVFGNRRQRRAQLARGKKDNKKQQRR